MLWEAGAMHDLRPYPPGAPAEWPWADERRYGTGRDALRALLAHGRVHRGWRRLWVPDYFCQDVVAALQQCELELRIYPDDPLRPLAAHVDTAAGDAVLVHNAFGLRGLPVLPAGVDIVEDHSHDLTSPWAHHSSAAYAAASLRKTLPVPDGGVLWSPAGLPLPPPVPCTLQRERAGFQRLAAMHLKALYLAGHAVPKPAYRALSIAGEEHIAAGPISGMGPWTDAVLDSLPIAEWTAARRRNHAQLREALEGTRVTLAASQPGAGTPLSALLVTETPEARDALSRGLIERDVYPAVLWSLEEPAVDGIGAAALDLSRRTLLVHVDHRYGAEDIERIADHIRAVA